MGMARNSAVRHPVQRRTTSIASVGVWGCLALFALRHGEPRRSAFTLTSQDGCRPSLLPQRQLTSKTARRASGVLDQVKNPVKTVSDTLAEFYKGYSQPPLLPVYRPFIIDLLTQTHLAMVDSRFKYDAVFALGLWEYFQGLMGMYDKMVKGGESDRIWTAMVGSIGLNGNKVKDDAKAMIAYAKSTPPQKLLKHLEGAEKPSDAKAAEAFEGIRKNLYSTSYSIGLFKIMEACGVEPTTANVEEWAKALKIGTGKVTTDLATYRQNQNKLQKAEEMIREVEIREKKKLAERLEQKAKALAEKAAAKGR